MPLVSVVVPVYNIERYLCQCLDSIARQTLQDIEIICVDDGSTDGSSAILNKYAGSDSRFQLLTQSNLGAGVARNVGMARASGKYLIFLDSDDWFEVDFLEKMVLRAEVTNADITICKSVEFDTDTGCNFPSEWMLKTEYLSGTVFTPEDVASHIFQLTYGWPWDKLYRTAFVKEQQMNYPPLQNSEDLVFVFLSVALSKRIAVLEDIMVHHRIHRKTSVSNSRHHNMEAPYIALCLLRKELKKHDRYELFEQSFLNWAIEFLVWHISSLNDLQMQRKCLKAFRSAWLPSLGLSKSPTTSFITGRVYVKYIVARYTPYPFFVLATRGYSFAKRICSLKRRVY